VPCFSRVSTTTFLRTPSPATLESKLYGDVVV
jgi:hypothetical protein